MVFSLSLYTRGIYSLLMNHTFRDKDIRSVTLLWIHQGQALSRGFRKGQSDAQTVGTYLSTVRTGQFLDFIPLSSILPNQAHRILSTS